jgi:hypothetical protein
MYAIRMGGWLGAILALVAGGGDAGAAAAPEKTFPPEMIDAWKKAGFVVGWMSLDEGDDAPVKSHLCFRAARPWAPEAQEGELPAVATNNWPKGILRYLPAPPVPFGLMIFGRTMDDGALEELAPLKSIQYLDLSATKVSGTGLKALTGLPKLQVLSLTSTEMSIAGVKALGSLDRLEVLNLRGTTMSNGGLRALADLPKLQVLNLSRTPLSDAGLRELAGCKRLRNLNIQGLNSKAEAITPDGITFLKKANPILKIRQ